MGLVTRGERELDLLLERFPADVHDRLRARITGLTDELRSRVEGAAPVRTGQLRSEIQEKVYGEQPQRIAGYVQVVAAQNPAREYAKAASLEYGVNKPRRVFERAANRFESLAGHVSGAHRRLVERVSRTVHMRAFRYLRDPIEEMRPEVESELADALAGDGSS